MNFIRILLLFNKRLVFKSGIISLLADIRPNNDLGHPLCVNLREGNWLIGNILERFQEIIVDYDINDM